MANQVPGKGVLYTNKKKTQTKQPDFTGGYMTQEGTYIKLSGWLKDTPQGRLISLAEDTFKRENKSYPREVSNQTEDDIPF